jgi:hypothetical protein
MFSLIKLLGGYTQKEFEEIKSKYELKEFENRSKYEQKIDKLPKDIIFKYGLSEIDGIFIDKCFFEKKLNASLKNYVPILKVGNTLLCGSAGAGKDWFLQKCLENNNNRKVLFVGREYEYSDKFGYLKRLGFVRYSFGENVSFDNKSIFIGESLEESYRDFVHYDYLKSMVKSAIKKGYIVVFNEIFGKNDKYYKLISEMTQEKNGDIVAVIQTLDDFTYSLNDNLIRLFDTLILMKNAVLSDNELFKQDEDLNMLSQGDFIEYDKSRHSGHQPNTNKQNQ